MIKGVIFDMDGLLLDSERLYVRFWIEAARSLGYPMELSHALGMRSLGRSFAIKRIKEYFGESADYYAIRAKRIELMDKYIESNGIEKKKGADTLLCYLKENNIKTAVATATPVERAKQYLERVKLLQYFDEIISAHMVQNGKPAPDIYLLAAQSLSLEPSDCLALEDSPNGVQSASSAGCVTVMVPDLDTPDEKTKSMLYSTAEDLEKVIDLIKSMK